jgi:serine acetyltransferase
MQQGTIMDATLASAAASAAEAAPAPAAESPGRAAPMTLAASLALFRADLTRRFELLEEEMTVGSVLSALTRPGVMGVLLLRIGNWLHAGNHRIGFRLIERLIFLVTRSELQPGCQVGPGLVLADEGTIGLTAHCRIGANCTLFGLATIVPQEGGRVDTVLGDHCVLGRRARVYGAVTLADGIQVMENSLVLTSLKKSGMIVSGIPARRRGQVPLEVVRSWNPLKGRPLSTTRPLGGAAVTGAP